MRPQGEKESFSRTNAHREERAAFVHVPEIHTRLQEGKAVIPYFDSCYPRNVDGWRGCKNSEMLLRSFQHEQDSLNNK